MGRAADELQPIVHNIQAVVDVERRAVRERTWLERTTDTVTAAAGSAAFIAAHALVFGVWLWVNTHVARPFDPYPFVLLGTIVSFEAIFLSSFVLMTQNRMTEQANRRAHLDLQVNLLAEQELTTILHMLNALCEHAGVRVRVKDERVAALLKETDVHTIVSALDDVLRNGET
jgi:uncharacterized membrane protein